MNKLINYKIFTLTIKANTKIYFCIWEKVISNINILINIENGMLTEFSYDSEQCNGDLVLYKVANDKFILFVDIMTNDMIIINDLKFDPLACSIEFNMIKDTLPTNFISKNNCISQHAHNDFYTKDIADTTNDNIKKLISDVKTTMNDTLGTVTLSTTNKNN